MEMSVTRELGQMSFPLLPLVKTLAARFKEVKESQSTRDLVVNPHILHLHSVLIMISAWSQTFPASGAF